MNYTAKLMEPGLTNEGSRFNAVQPLGEQLVSISRSGQ